MQIQRILTLAVTVIACTPAAYGGWACSIDHAYPEVSELKIEDGKLVAVLGTYFAHTKDRGSAERPRYLIEHPRLSMSAGGKWERDGLGGPPDMWDGSGQQCIDAPEDPEAAWKAAHYDAPFARAEGDWFDQSVTSCASDGKAIWGGISFYGAEGGWGVGGLVKKDTETGFVEYVRPPKLIGGSTGPLAYFADSLWMGTTWFGECAGPTPGTGLKKLKYYPHSDFYGVDEVPEVCGFAIRDFQEFDGALWIATELGLSKLVDDDGAVWTNFVPDLDHPELLRQVSCDAFYTELLTSSRFAEIEGFDIGNAFDVFWKRLSTLRPNFARRYLRELHGHSAENYPGGNNQMLWFGLDRTNNIRID